MAEQVAAADDAALLEKLLWTSKDEADCETWRSAKIKAWEAGEKIKEKYPERAQLASTRVEIGAPSSRRIFGAGQTFDFYTGLGGLAVASGRVGRKHVGPLPTAALLGRGPLYGGRQMQLFR